MPVWDKVCPKCGRPIRVDTQSSRLYCTYCNTEFFTDEFLINKTKYHKKNSSQKSTTTKSDSSFSSFFNSILGKTPSKAKKDTLSEGFEILRLFGIMALFTIAAPVLLAKFLNSKVKYLGTIVVLTLVAGIIAYLLLSCTPATPAWQGEYYPNKTTIEQNEKVVDLKGSTSCKIDEDGYVITLNLTLPISMQKRLEGTYTEHYGVLSFDTADIYMSNQKIYLELDLREDGYGIITIEYALKQ